MNSYRPQSPLERGALETAQSIHAGHRLNPFSGAHFIERPKNVALALTMAGERTSTVASGLLHAVPEHSPIDGRRIIRRFGHEVTHLVTSVSGNPSIIDNSERHEIYLARLFNTGNIAVLSLAAAIKSAKLQELLDAHNTAGDRIWDIDGYNADDTNWEAETTHEILDKRIPDHPIVKKFGKQIVDLQKLV